MVFPTMHFASSVMYPKALLLPGMVLLSLNS
ncbi:hypothetical protein FOXYSP1_14455 [Fusarium oxysporum f. sp. phaseoli]